MSLDRVKEGLAAFIRQVMSTVDYHALYSATLHAASNDGFVEVLPDDERIRGTGLQKVRLKHGLPGVAVKVEAGARVLIGFENGDASKPYAALWDPGSILEIAFDGGTKSLARVDDSVSVTVPAGTFLTAAQAGVLNPAPVTLEGKITSGNDKLKG